ncbi:hypothetical protein [Novilysobacter defluvii]|uniref:Uncharacterized protein n=1 Tax=Lysobacter defluvii IMMIB APB-9 = DSM 18482 TaxID=1385515 RepID=A0A0A0M8Z8_9GAMM|nr:hypothetical protein [Lysobacter defluvii]KGO99488.1 hypothetical protein N791_03255 [Lysobacter defluvii IMMIB APB-9 = DSM 18482]
MNDKHRPEPESAAERAQDRARREYPHGTGDRNTHPLCDERGEFHGGEQRDERPGDAPGAGRAR